MQPLNQITKEQQDHLLNGGEMIYFVLYNIKEISIGSDGTPWNIVVLKEDAEMIEYMNKTHFFANYSSIQPNTKYYLQEEFSETSDYIYYGKGAKEPSPLKWKPSEEMQPHQARHFFEFDVEIKRIQDLVAFDGDCIDYVNSLSEKEYEDNNYIIVAKVKR